MRRLLFALPILAAAPPVLAQNPPPAVDLVARFMAGVADDAWVFTDYWLARMEQTGPGTFKGDSSGSLLELEVVEAEPCIFDLRTTFDGSSPGRLRLDARALNTIKYQEAETIEIDVVLTGYFITLEGVGGFLTLPDSTGADGLPQDAVREYYWMTSLEPGAPADALRELQAHYCPPSEAEGLAATTRSR
jgi:hypothetical protein